MRARRQQLRDLCRKYGDDVAEVLAYRDEAARRLAELEGFDQRAAELDAARAAAVADGAGGRRGRSVEPAGRPPRPWPRP